MNVQINVDQMQIVLYHNSIISNPSSANIFDFCCACFFLLGVAYCFCVASVYASGEGKLFEATEKLFRVTEKGSEKTENSCIKKYCCTV